MADGEFTVPLVPDTPRRITDLVYEYFSLVHIYSAHIPTDLVSPPTAFPWGVLPQFSGVVLERPDPFTIRGPGLSWYFGQASSGGTGIGPYSTWSASYTGTLASVAPTVVGGTNDVQVFYTDTTASKTIYMPPRGTLRDAVLAICATFGVEWSINPDVSLNFGANLWGTTPKAIVAKDLAGRDPNITGLNGASMTLAGSRLNYANGVYINQGTATAASQTYADGIMTPGGSPLHMHKIISDTSLTNAAQSNLVAIATLADAKGTQDTLTINVDEYAVTDGLVPCGSWVGMFDPQQRLYDTSNPVQFRGALIYPVNIRCVGVDWQIRQGMGVYHDARHLGGALTDLTDYIAWESGTDTLTVGTQPYMLDLQPVIPH
jgi:hypothetical protein